MNSVNPIQTALLQLEAMRTQAAEASQPDVGTQAASEAGLTEFGQLFQKSLEKISARQARVGQEYQAFELGASNVSLNDVMVDGAKANIDFRESLEVRNRLVSAYTTIMQMPL